MGGDEERRHQGGVYEWRGYKGSRTRLYPNLEIVRHRHYLAHSSHAHIGHSPMSLWGRFVRRPVGGRMGRVASFV